MNTLFTCKFFWRRWECSADRMNSAQLIEWIVLCERKEVERSQTGPNIQSLWLMVVWPYHRHMPQRLHVLQYQPRRHGCQSLKSSAASPYSYDQKKPKKPNTTGMSLSQIVSKFSKTNIPLSWPMAVWPYCHGSQRLQVLQSVHATSWPMTVKVSLFFKIS
jgi:hypothetical protein